MTIILMTLLAGLIWFSLTIMWYGGNQFWEVALNPEKTPFGKVGRILYAGTMLLFTAFGVALLLLSSTSILYIINN